MGWEETLSYALWTVSWHFEMHLVARGFFPFSLFPVLNCLRRKLLGRLEYLSTVLIDRRVTVRAHFLERLQCRSKYQGDVHGINPDIARRRSSLYSVPFVTDYSNLNGTQLPSRVVVGWTRTLRLLTYINIYSNTIKVTVKAAQAVTVISKIYVRTKKNYRKLFKAMNLSIRVIEFI